MDSPTGFVVMPEGGGVLNTSGEQDRTLSVTRHHKPANKNAPEPVALHMDDGRECREVFASKFGDSMVQQQ